LATRALIRLVGRTVQAIGVCLLAGSVAGLTGSGLSQASGYFAAVVAQVKVMAPPTAPPTAGPVAPPGVPASPTPGPVSTPTFHTRRGGPLEFSLNGSMSLGENSIASQRTDQFGAPVTSGATQANTSVGLYAELKRRTANATADVRLPLGLSMTGAQFGAVLMTYSTPHYALQYGSQPINLFGQVPLGSTLRGPALVLPQPSGDLTLYEGAAFGVGLEGVHVTGVRMRRLAGNDLFELGVVRNAYAPQTGTATTAIAGYATSHGNAAFVGELADQTRNGPDGHRHGFATQWRMDLGGVGTGWTLVYRHVSDGFLAYGSGELNADDFEDVGFRAATAAKNFSTDLTFEKTGTGDAILQSRRSSMSYGGTLGATNYQLTLQESRQAGAQPVQWNGGAQFQYGIPLSRGFVLLGAQLGRSTVDGSAPTGLSLFTGQIQRQFGDYALQFSTQSQRQSNAFAGVSRLQTQAFGVNRTFGRTGLGYTYTVSTTRSPYADAVQRTPQIAISRQISPALSVQVSVGTQSLEDRLNPDNSGRTRLFNVVINAPFAFGNGAVQGRIDPRLPAIIAGRVLSDLGDNLAVAGLAAGGIGNVVVVLDGGEVQRTDLDGNFQFSFVHPGQHQLRLESASLPRGLTADQPIVTLNVEGGQTGQVYFRVGNFGGVSGHVFGRDSNGGQVPLRNVLVRVDGSAYSQTDQDGAYGFGRLSPGAHTVAIVDNTVPAFASFTKDQESQKIDVRNGQIAALDFVAQPLGSIAGFVRYDAGLGEPYVGGVSNAYVVAEPGEHAAITNDDGSFVIDNLPPGAYQVSVDPETVADDVAPLGDPLAVTLNGNDKYEGAAFVVGHKVKSVVFSFLGGGASAATVRLDDSRLPPGGTTTVSYVAPPGIKDASVKVFDRVFALTYDAKRSVWRGTIEVPKDAKAAPYDVTASAIGISSVATATLTVDPKVPIAILQVTPANVAPGQYASVRARFLVDVRAGDTIAWSDGTTTVLGKPVAGRVFTFTLRISLRPLYGTLLTRHARLPIRLL